MDRNGSNGLRLLLVCAVALVALAGCAGSGKGKKGAASTSPAVTTEKTPRAISTGDIAIYSRDEKVVDGAWMRITGLTSKNKLSDGITFSLMATDRSQKELSPEPTWKVSDPSVASVKPAVGPIVDLAVLKAGKATITVKSGSRTAVFDVEASAAGAKLVF
ncbi:MAG: hypothetical protein EHM19_01005 [Candidatus Latescibacterota bacterium]|nr:MAG: hypothetical protein EHM19_01005 [Candidatus Latescibacterota bacterium]